ncbi:MAG: hypothetical protein ACLTWL_02315 [Eubacterium callanderi]
MDFIDSPALKLPRDSRAAFLLCQRNGAEIAGSVPAPFLEV